MSESFQQSRFAPTNRAGKTPQAQHLRAIMALAVKHLYDHGLTPAWGVKWDNAVRRAGYCMHSRRIISLSKPIMSTWTIEQAEQTILHELAHALVGPGHGHDSVWKAKCVELGIAPTRCYGVAPGDTRTALPSKYVGTCAKGHEYSRNRLPSKPVSCGYCNPKKYDARFPLTWKRRTSRTSFTSN